MRIVVSDTSCMIDLRKAGLLEAALGLPYTFVMPDTLFEDEWLSLNDAEKRPLLDLGLEVHGLPGPSVERAAWHFNQHRRLKLNDCFALTLAEEIEGCILLTGDGFLRRIAEGCGIEVRGVLWVTDELEAHGVVPLSLLHQALQLFHEDELVYLPEREVRRRIRRLARRI
ncbi:MAG TPA: type II toxin-antitoxin system VapC family toxin [Alphaproteobacteria bacterium]|jgi:predicted nucleic acid-binding protein|nr:type II toxin-antitoxin system VapC family toxin [Alphaproteobacteria bacterium]|tara:strand:+ start:1699 stop:2208 length:510 start_codon:yes stop_codon:yes gene_type:complete